MAKDGSSPVGKMPVKVYLPPDLVETIKEAVWHQRRTLSEFVESGARRELAATAAEAPISSDTPHRLPPGRRPSRPSGAE